MDILHIFFSRWGYGQFHTFAALHAAKEPLYPLKKWRLSEALSQSGRGGEKQNSLN
jgi:hypothetical protein